MLFEVLRNKKRKLNTYLLRKLSEKETNFITYFRVIFIIVIDLVLVKYSFYKLLINSNCFILGASCGILIFIINFFLTKGFRKLKVQYFQPKSTSFTKSLVSNNFINILIIISSVFFEELIFRSYLLSVTKNYFGIFLSIAINALLFYAVHLNKRIVQLILMAIFFSLITIYTNSIFPAILGHIINNILCLFEINLKNKKIVSSHQFLL